MIDLMFPCADGWGSQSFHTSSPAHYGIDIGWTSVNNKNGNSEIYAAADGEIVFEGFYPEVFSGKTYKPIGVIIKHNFSDTYDYYTIYWHLASTCINKGQKVKRGDKIGIKGNTGYSMGTHLHFQLIKVKKGSALPKSSEWKNCSVDPTPYITVYDDIQYFVRDGKTKVAYPYDLKHSRLNTIETANAEEIKALNETITTLRAEVEKLNLKLSKIKELVL